MKCKALLLSLLVLASTYSVCQTLNPTELESAILAKLKAQHDERVTRLGQLNTQLLLLQTTKILAQQEEQEKLSELQGKAEQIIKEHGWEADYRQDATETGSFVIKSGIKPKEINPLTISPSMEKMEKK